LHDNLFDPGFVRYLLAQAIPSIEHLYGFYDQVAILLIPPQAAQVSDELVLFALREPFSHS
jgi:hypothetical protein